MLCYCSFGYSNFNMPKMEEKISVVLLQRNLILINAEGLKFTGLRMTFSESLMEKNGYLEGCHQLNPNDGIKQLENQRNPCPHRILSRLQRSAYLMNVLIGHTKLKTRESLVYLKYKS